MSDEMKKKLEESELINVAGGRTAKASSGAEVAEIKQGAGKTTHYCIKCQKDTPHIVYSGTRMVCQYCGTQPTL